MVTNEAYIFNRLLFLYLYLCKLRQNHRESSLFFVLFCFFGIYNQKLFLEVICDHHLHPKFGNEDNELLA